MTLETLAVPTLDSADSIFDFSRPAVEPLALSDSLAPLAATRREPEPGWAAANPEKAMLFLFLTPREGRVAEELFAL
jgi:hypothetical protein